LKIIQRKLSLGTDRKSVFHIAVRYDKDMKSVKGNKTMSNKMPTNRKDDPSDRQLESTPAMRMQVYCFNV